MASGDVERLRAEYIKTRKNVSAKIARVKKTTGANVAGSNYDPRKPVGHEKRLNAAQLRSGIAKMQEFNRRSVQFVSLDRGVPLSKIEWAPFQSKINLRNIKQQRFASEIDKQRFPGMEQSATSRQNMTVEKADGGRIGPFDIAGNEPSNYTSLNAIKRMEKKINEELKPEFRSKQLAIARQQLDMAMLMMGEDKETRDFVSSLNEYQFNLLWYDSDIPETAFQKYGAWMAVEEGSAREWQKAQVERSELSELIEDARRAGIPQAPSETGQAQKARGRAQRRGKR